MVYSTNTCGTTDFLIPSMTASASASTTGMRTTSTPNVGCARVGAFRATMTSNNKTNRSPLSSAGSGVAATVHNRNEVLVDDRNSSPSKSRKSGADSPQRTTTTTSTDDQDSPAKWFASFLKSTLYCTPPAEDLEQEVNDENVKQPSSRIPMFRGLEHIYIGNDAAISVGDGSRHRVMSEAIASWNRHLEDNFYFGELKYTIMCDNDNDEDEDTAISSRKTKKKEFALDADSPNDMTRAALQLGLDQSLVKSEIVEHPVHENYFSFAETTYLPDIEAGSIEEVLYMMKQKQHRNALRIYDALLQQEIEAQGGNENTVPVAICQHNKAILSLVLGDKKHALYCFYTACETKRELLGPHHPSTLDTMRQLVMALYISNEFDRALNMSKQLIQSQRVAKDYVGMVATLNVMGCIRYQMKNYDGALYELERALTEHKVNTEREEEEEDEYHMDLNAEKKKEKSTIRSHAHIMANFGAVKMAMDETEEAMTLLNEALVLFGQVLDEKDDIITSLFRRFRLCEQILQKEQEESS